MKTPISLFRFLIICLLFISCDDSKILEPNRLLTYNNDEVRVFNTENVSNIKIANNLGGIRVTGWSSDSKVRIYMYKTISAISNDVAEVHFEDISSSFSNLGDTLNFEIIYPPNTDEINYKYCALSIEIPYKMNCKIQDVDGPISISQLNSNVWVKGLESNVAIDKHEGSCEVNSNQEIRVEMILANNNFCKLNSVDGNVFLSIPDTTNSSVDLTTENGTITYNQLIFSTILQDAKSLSGLLGSGNAQISLNSKNGNIELTGF